MSDYEALMWNLEKDPALSSWFASITVLDTVPSLERLRARLATAVAEIPRLRQRVAPGVGRLAPPRWVDDTDFDLDFHVRRLALPAPGSDDELHEVAVKLLLDPFERSRPLWQFTVIEGLSGGRAALFQKMHHTITDGEGGVRLAERFVDLERDAPDGDPPVVPMPTPVRETFADAARGVVGHNLRRVGGLAQRVVGGVVRDPGAALSGVGSAVEELRRTLLTSDDPDEQHGSTLWHPRTLRRWYGTHELDFDDVKRAAKALGGTINDVFVAGALAGAAAYHAERDALPHRLRVAMPVSTRKGGAAGGNSFSLTTSDLLAEPDPLVALEAVREGLARAKSGASLDIVGNLSMVINLLPTSVLTTFAKDTAATVDLTVSNVRGAPVPLYIAGARCDAVFPMGPISGTAVNISTLSYAGQLDVGMVVDSGAVAEPRALHAAIGDAWATLVAAGR